MKNSLFILLRVLLLFQLIEVTIGMEDLYAFFTPPMKNLMHGYYVGVKSKVTGSLIHNAYLSCDGGKTKLHLKPYGPAFKVSERTDRAINNYNNNPRALNNYNERNRQRTISFLKLEGYSLLFAHIDEDKKNAPYDYLLIDGLNEECFPNKCTMDFDAVNIQLERHERYIIRRLGNIGKKFFEFTGRTLKVLDNTDDEIKNTMSTTSFKYPSLSNKDTAHPYFKCENVTIKIYDADGNRLSDATIVLAEPQSNLCTIV